MSHDTADICLLEDGAVVTSLYNSMTFTDSLRLGQFNLCRYQLPYTDVRYSFIIHDSVRG